MITIWFSEVAPQWTSLLPGPHPEAVEQQHPDLGLEETQEQAGKRWALKTSILGTYIALAKQDLLPIALNISKLQKSATENILSGCDHWNSVAIN